MKANVYPLSTIFGLPCQLMAPLFQRPYVWEKDKQWKPLWEDICGVAEALNVGNEATKPHFLGAIVLDQQLMPMRHIATRFIIDGQQRLATLQVFFAAFRDACRGAIEDSPVPEGIEEMMYNKSKMLEEELERFKVLPTNVDRAAYGIVMGAGSPKAARSQMLEDTSTPGGRLFNACKYFFDVLSEWLNGAGEDAEKRARALLQALGYKIVMVVIDINDEDDSQMIFETLNTRGAPLLPSDLVKNYLFREAVVEGASLERLYDKYWKPFDDDIAFWRGQMRYGRRKRERTDLFLHHYLTLMRADEVSVEKLFAEFQEFAPGDGHRNAEWHLRQLHDYAAIFRSFLDPQPDDREGLFFHRIDNMETTTAFPFLLGLYHDLGNGDNTRTERVAILEDIESFLVRRMVCGLTSKNYNRFFLDLIGAVREDGAITHEEVREFLLSGTGESVRWPDDEEFRSAWVDRPLYKTLYRNRLRMILHALDAGLRDGKTEEYDVNFILTVEHIMPNAWDVHWPLSSVEGETPEQHVERIDRRNGLIQTIGNLTMLTETLNPAVSNGPFELKHREINKFSVLSLNRFLCYAQNWDEHSIRQRSKDLFQVACKTWPYPDAAV